MKAQQHVLIVDNDDGFRKAAEVILRKEGYRTSIAWNGSEGLNIILTSLNNCHPVDILLTDLRMPDMDGFDLMANMKREHIRIPTVAVTAYGDAETLARLIHFGVNGYLAKPCTVKDLLDAVRSAGGETTYRPDDVPGAISDQQLIHTPRQHNRRTR
jgi:two-component system, NtrC family, response regulator AtoC